MFIYSYIYSYPGSDCDTAYLYCGCHSDGLAQTAKVTSIYIYCKKTCLKSNSEIAKKMYFTSGIWRKCSRRCQFLVVYI